MGVLVLEFAEDGADGITWDNRVYSCVGRFNKGGGGVGHIVGRRDDKDEMTKVAVGGFTLMELLLRLVWRLAQLESVPMLGILIGNLLMT